VTAATAERRVLLPAAIFTVTDTFVVLRGVDGTAAARQASGTLTFQLDALGSGAARQALGPGWTLPVVRGASGAFISDGTVTDPGGSRRRPIGPALAVELTITGSAYRATPVPPPAPGPPPNPAPRLVNLDPAQPPVAVVPFPVQLSPGYGYPFPGPPYGYSVLRGEVYSGAAGAPAGPTQVTATAAAGGWTDTYPTDSTGQWLFVLPDAQAGEVTVTAGPARVTVTVAPSSTVAVPPLILP
jgi:hypothetical protein